MDFIPNNVKVLLDVRIYKQDNPGSSSSSSSTGQGIGSGSSYGQGSSSQGQGSKPSVARGIESSFDSTQSSLSKGLGSNNMFGGSVRQDIIPYRPNMTFQNLNTDTVLFDPLVKITDATIKSAGKYTQLQFLVPDQFNELILKMNRQSGNASKTFFYTELDQGPIQTAILENNTITIKPSPIKNIQDINLSTLMKPSLVYTRLNNASKVTQDKDEFKNDDKYTTFISINSVDNSKLIIINDSKKNRQTFDVKILGSTKTFYSKPSLELLLDATKDGTVSNNMKLTMDNLFALNSKMFLDSSELSIYKQSQSNWLYNLSNNYDTLYKERFLFKHKLNPNYFDRLKYNIIRQLEVYYKDNESALKEYDKTNNTVKEVFSNNYSVVSSGVRKIITQEFNKFLSEMIVKDFPSIDYFIKYKEYLIKEYKNIVDLDDKNIPVEIRFTDCPDFYIYSFKWNEEAYNKSPKIQAQSLVKEIIPSNQTDVDKIISKIDELSDDNIKLSTNSLQEFIFENSGKKNKCITDKGTVGDRKECQLLKTQFKTKLDKKYESYDKYIKELDDIISSVIVNDTQLEDEYINFLIDSIKTIADYKSTSSGGAKDDKIKINSAAKIKLKAKAKAKPTAKPTAKAKLKANPPNTKYENIQTQTRKINLYIENNEKLNELPDNNIDDIKQIIDDKLISAELIEKASKLLKPSSELTDIDEKIGNINEETNISAIQQINVTLKENKLINSINTIFKQVCLEKIKKIEQKIVEKETKQIAEKKLEIEKEIDKEKKKQIEKEEAKKTKYLKELLLEIVKDDRELEKIEEQNASKKEQQDNETEAINYINNKTDTLIKLIKLINEKNSDLLTTLIKKIFDEWKILINIYYEMKKSKELKDTPFPYKDTKETKKNIDSYLSKIYEILLITYNEELTNQKELNNQFVLKKQYSDQVELFKEATLQSNNNLFKTVSKKQQIIINTNEQNNNLKKENTKLTEETEANITIYTEKLKEIEKTITTPDVASAPGEVGPDTRSKTDAAEKSLVEQQTELVNKQLELEKLKRSPIRDDNSDSTPRDGGSKQNGGATTNESTLTLRLQNYFKLYSPYQEEICKAANCDITKSNPNNINVLDKYQNNVDRQNFFGSIYTAITEYNDLPTSSSTQITFTDRKNKDIPRNFKTFLEQIYEDITSKLSGSGQKLDEIYNEKLKKYLPTKNNKTSEPEYLDLLKKNPDKLVQSFEKGLLPYEPNIGNLDTNILKLNEIWSEKFNSGDYYLDDISTKPIYNILRQILSINLIVIDNATFKLTTCEDLRDSSNFVIFLLRNKDNYFLISYQNQTAYSSNNFKISSDKISQLGLFSPPLFIYLYIVNSCNSRDYENQFGDFYTTVIKSQLDGKNKRLFADYISKIKEGIVKINANAIISNTTSSLSSTNLAITKSTYCYYITVTLDLYEGKLPFMQKQTMGCEIKRQNIITDFTELTGIKLLPSIAENKYLSLLPQDAPKPSWLTSITGFLNKTGIGPRLGLGPSADANANPNKGKTTSTPSATALNKPRHGGGGGGGTRRKIILTYKRQNNIKNVKNVRNMKEIKARLSRKLHNITHKLFKS